MNAVTVSVRDARAQPADRLWIQSVYREYLNDLSALNTGIFPVLGEFGHREPDLLAAPAERRYGVAPRREAGSAVAHR